MIDTHEEHLLNGLFSDIAREDARLDAAHLEARVVAGAMSPRPGFTTGRPGRWAVVAAVCAAVLAPALIWLRPDVSPHAPAAGRDATEETIANGPRPVAAAPSAPARPVARRRSSPAQPSAAAPVNHASDVEPTIANSSLAQFEVAEPPVAQSPVTHSSGEFVPLVPMTAQELTGSFQIVRVQMPRASLGALRSPLESPNELVEADVLLGEDGMARGIRLSTGGSVYPWRSR